MRSLRCLAASLLVTVLPAALLAQDQPAGTQFTVGEGKLAFTAPEGWKKKQPASRIVEAELEVPAAKGDEAAGRLTAMGAGGSVEANIERWVGQFVDSPQPKVDKLTVAGCQIQVVDLSGTYKDTPGGPFAGGRTILREDYRMLGAIIETKDAGNYFLKLYGPKETITQAHEGFVQLVKGMKVK
jgi:hypothetical protein